MAEADILAPDETRPTLERHFGLLPATALNVTSIIGAGIFITVPLMLGELPGPYAILGWVAAGVLMMFDGLVWAELGAALPGSGGTYLYHLECYGKEKWGRLMAFLFIWQFLISGPLEISTALIAIAQFSQAITPSFAEFNARHTWSMMLWEPGNLGISFGPSRVVGLAVGVMILLLLYRKVTSLAKLTITVWLGVIGACLWILIEGLLRFDPAVAFSKEGLPPLSNEQFASGLGGAMILAMYSYLGYYNVCYMGDEVKNPGKTIPRSIILSGLIVGTLFVGMHVAMLSVVPWQSIPTKPPEVDKFILPVEFMRRIHGEWAAALVVLMLIWSCFGSAMSQLLSYSRIPFGAARYGHFFAKFGELHPLYGFPYISLLLVAGMTVFWSVFDLGSVISALIVTRILEQFLGQILGLTLLRRMQPDRPRPYRMWLYPLPSLIAMAGWLYMYVASGLLFVLLGLATLLCGALVFFLWSAKSRAWPFAPAKA